MIQLIKNRIRDHIDIINLIVDNTDIPLTIEKSANLIIDAFNKGNKVLFCGNGGSAADAQHLAAELSGRFKFYRAPLFAEALHTNTSYLTAVANDYGYDLIYSRLINGMGKSGDILVGISTSGKSKNIINAINAAKKNNMTIITFTGQNTNPMDELSDVSIKIPTNDTARIQEGHILIGHIICEIIENKLFK